MLSTSPTSQSTKSFSFSTAAPVISANLDANGIPWIVDNSSFGSSCCQTLYAYDATNLATLLYARNQALKSRDAADGAVKFTAPAGGQASVTAYGLLSSAPQSTTTSLASSLNSSYVTQPVTLTAPSKCDVGEPGGIRNIPRGKNNPGHGSAPRRTGLLYRCVHYFGQTLHHRNLFRRRQLQR
jgi:hypothetical protein